MIDLQRLRRFDIQARIALVMAAGSVVPLLGGVWLTISRYHHDLGQIVYGEGSFFLPSFAVCLLLSSGPALLGLGLGLNSAGQRRNDRPMHAWVGFFLGSSVLAVNVILAGAFVMLRVSQPI